MRSSILGFLSASLLVKDLAAVAIPLKQRDLYIVLEDVIVTEIATVTALSDGSFATGAASPVGTGTTQAAPVLATNGVPVLSSSALASSAPVSSVVIASSAPASLPAASSEASVPATTAKAVSVPGPIVKPSPMKSTTPVAVDPTTSSAPAAQSSTAPVTTTGGNKRGLAFNYDSPSLSNFLTGSSKISWSYNWGATAGAAPNSIEFIPMLWGLGDQITKTWSTVASAAIASGSKHLLGFNEPDLGAQSNLSPADAAKGWTTFMQPFAGKALLGSPAVTNGGAPMGLAWLSNFVSECKNCQIDFVCIHWYNGGDADAFKTYVQQAYKAGGNRPVWITEFEAPGNSADEQNQFLDTVLPWLDSQDFVGRYAYFGAFDGKLLGSGSALSSIGQTYAFSG